MAHTSWRLRIWSNLGDVDEQTIAEVQFRASSGGADQATGGTAIHSVGPFGTATTAGAASQAFDDNTATNWSLTEPATNRFPYAIGYTFGSAVDVAEVAVIAPSSTTARAPRIFDVQWSDDATAWATYWTIAEQGTWTNGETRVFTGPTFPAGVLATNLDAYAVTGTGVGIAASDLAGYAVTGTGLGVAASGLAGYAVYLPPVASTARPVVNIIT